MIISRLLILGCFCFLLSSSYAQDKEGKPAFDLTKIKDTTSYNAKANDLYKILADKEGAVSLEQVDDFIALGNELNHTNGLGKAHDIKAMHYMNQLEYAEAITFFKKAIVYYKETNNEKEIAHIHNKLHKTEKLLGNLEKSAYYLLEAKKYFDKVKDDKQLAVIYTNLGVVNFELKDYTQSEESFLKAIKMNQKLGYKTALDDLKNNLALVYVKDKKIEEAKELVSQSLAFYKKENIRDKTAFSYSIFGEIALEEGEFKTAQKYYDSANVIYKDLAYNYKIIETKQRLGFIEFQLGNYKKSEALLTFARKGFSEANSKEKLLKNYEISSKLDSARGNLTEALAWQRKYQSLSDQVASELSTKQIESTEEFYKSELDQIRTIDEQEARAQRNKEDLFRSRVFALIVLGILAFSVLYGFWIIRTRKERKKLIKQLNDSNQVKHKLFSIISHDLKNEIHGLESSLNLMNDDLISTDEFGEVVPLLAERTNQTSILLNNLLNWSKSQMKELKANPINFEVGELISNKFVFFNPKASKKNIDLINKLETTNVHADKDMVAIVAQNLIANAIKFCSPGDSISLLSEDKGDFYEIHFQDTGVGIPPDALSKLFAEETFTTRGTNNEAGTGLGLRICKELVELNKGKIRVSSVQGEGSTFSILLPKAAS